MQLNTFPVIIVENQFPFTVKLNDWNWREGSAVINAGCVDNRNVQIEEIGQSASVSASDEDVG